MTEATEQIGNRHDMTRVHEEVTYCPPSTSPGKQKKNRSTSQPQFRSENTLRRSKQTRFYWLFSSWQTATILRTFKIISTEFPNRQTHQPQRCPRWTGNLRNLSCLKSAD